ncbi:MAG: hypothetical protein P8018_14140, partial [Acidobacteriota bacterium]
GARGRNGALLAVNLASASGLSELAIDGVVSKEADALLSLPGLLNYLGPENLQPVLDRAKQKGIRIRAVNAVDPDTVARTVWTSLLAARRQGVALGKYGTFPLTLEETDRVVGEVQRWFGDWSAAPVFFVDHGILTAEKVYTRDFVVDGVKAWLDVVAKHGVPVVLIDTLDKSAGWKILKDASTEQKGLLSKGQIQSIDAFAAQRGIRVLWAGGITLPQVYEFGKMGVFGIYVTSAAAAAVPVGPAYERDPALAALKEPTFEGVSRAKLLLEAGFLAEKQRDKQPTKDFDTLAHRFISELAKGKASNGQRLQELDNELAGKTLDAWKSHPELT